MKSKTAAAKLPKRIFVYICDYENNEPIYSLAETIDELPEDSSGEIVGTYYLDCYHILKIERKLE